MASSASSSSAAPAARKSVKGSGFLGMMTGRRNRQETMLSIRKAKKEDAYATRRNLKANHPRAAVTQDADSRKELLQNLAQRSHALLLGASRARPQRRCPLPVHRASHTRCSHD